jgi:predicted TIM-barrel fold metal-dependent hydrolase
MIIDSQVHAYERDHPGRPWRGHSHGMLEATGEQVAAEMDAAGVDAAVLVSMFSVYRYDASYAVSVREAFPSRFALVKPVDFADPAVEEVIDDWARTDGAVGVRIIQLPDAPADAGLSRALAAAARRGLPVNLLSFDRLAEIGALARRFPDCQLIVDHLGLRPAVRPPVPPNLFDRLPEVLALAAFDNIALKISGAGALSSREYPFPDIWDPLWRIFDAFGFERCLWGTDFTRAIALLNYKQAVDAFLDHARFSAGERDTLMGGALQKIYDWRP